MLCSCDGPPHPYDPAWCGKGRFVDRQPVEPRPYKAKCYCGSGKVHDFEPRWCGSTPTLEKVKPITITCSCDGPPHALRSKLVQKTS